MENIDIGGPSMARAAAKNFDRVAVIVDPADYPVVIAELRENGSVSQKTLARLAAPAFQHTEAYDAAIARYLADSVAGAPKQRGQHEADEGREAGPGLGREFTLGGTAVKRCVRREPASGSCLLPRCGRPPVGLSRSQAAGRQGTLLQQYRRRGCCRQSGG